MIHSPIHITHSFGLENGNPVWIYDEDLLFSTPRLDMSLDVVRT